jgi:hypothetical protein
MRASFLAVAASSVVVLVSTFAQTKFPLHPDTLARYEAISSFCEKADPLSASQYAAVLANLTQGHSPQEIARNRDSGKYYHALSEAYFTLSNASTDIAIKGCTEFLAENQPASGPR